MSLSNLHEKLIKNIKNLQFNLTQFITSNSHYKTQELTQYIQSINNGFDNIRLEYEFQRGTKDWSKQFNSNEIQLNDTKVQELISKGNDLVQHLNNQFHLTTIKSKKDNEIHEIHMRTCESLNEYHKILQPFSSGAYARLDNMAHHLGVTDRYVGYRNNLTRYQNQPIDVNTIWADRKLSETPTPDWRNWSHAFQHFGPTPTNLSSTSNDNNQHLLGYLSQKPSTDLFLYKEIPTTTTSNISRSRSLVYANDLNTHMTKAGMNVIYPGETETFNRFKKPEERSRSPTLQVAQPDYTSIGRPLSRLVALPTTSEYTQSFTYPDASNVELYPWLRA